MGSFTARSCEVSTGFALTCLRPLLALFSLIGRGSSAQENNNHELRCVEDTAVLAETCGARTIAICFNGSCSRVIARTRAGKRLD